jgi:hypothetical protein
MNRESADRESFETDPGAHFAFFLTPSLRPAATAAAICATSYFTFPFPLSSDGAINSWDRQPFVTTVFDGVTPSAQMLPRNISHNFLGTNYGGGNGAVDNDDGSLWFDNNNNFAVYGHQKCVSGGLAQLSLCLSNPALTRCSPHSSGRFKESTC